MQIRQSVRGQPRIGAKLEQSGFRRRRPFGDPVRRTPRIVRPKNRMPTKQLHPPECGPLSGQGMEAVVHRDFQAGRNVGFRLVCCSARWR